MSANPASVGETPAQYIVRVMSSHGFAPTNVYNAHFIEFTKTYADAQGRYAKAIVQFDRGDTRLSGFTVVVQAHLAATVELVEERAPPVMHDDLTDIVRAFEREERPPTVPAFEKCTACGAGVTEFFVVDGAVLCRECK